MASQEISEELEQLVVALDEEDPQARIAALEGMWQLREPIAIQFLVIIYNEDESPAVREKAAEVLGRFKGLSEGRASGKRRGRGARNRGNSGRQRGGRGLRTLLTVTLVLFAVINVGLFLMSNSDDNGEGSASTDDPAALRMSLLEAMEQDMVQTETIARDLRSRAIDYDDGLESLNTLCERDVEAAPEPIELSQQERELFPDVEDLATRPTGEYRFALAGLNAAIGLWNSACQNEDAILDSGRLIESTVTTIDAAKAAQENDIAVLMAAAFETPTPSVEPSPTTPPTPEPTPTPTARERSEIVESITVQPQRIQADAQEILNRVAAIDSGAGVSEQCDQANFWNPPGVMLNAEEASLYPELVAFGSNESSAFNTALAALEDVKTDWNMLCDNGRATAATIQTLEIKGERVINRVPNAQAEVDAAFGAGE